MGLTLVFLRQLTITCACLGLTVTATVSAQPPVLEPSPLVKQLRQSAVDALFQDRDLFLWLGTRDGLVRWDGSRTRSWQAIPGDDAALRHPIVIRIGQDPAGDIWVASRAFIHGSSQVSRLVAPRLERFVHYPQLQVELVFDRDARPWLVNPDGVHRYRREEDRFELWIPRQRPTGEAVGAVFDDAGHLWMISHNGLERCSVEAEARHCRVLARDPPPLQRLRIEADRGRIVLATRDGYVCASDLARDLDSSSALELEACSDLDGVASQGQLTDLERDARGDLWLATLEEVWRFADPPHRVPVRSGTGSADDDIYSLLGDHAGGMWGGTPWGLFYWDPTRQPFELVTIGSPPGIHSTAPIMTLHEDSSGRLWVGTIGDGLYARHLDGSWQHFPEDLWASQLAEQTSFVWSIASLDDVIWLATTHGLVRLDAVSGQTSLVPLPLQPTATTPPRFPTGVRKVLAQPPATLWIVSYVDTLFRWVAGQLTEIAVEPGFWVEDLAIQADGRIWLGGREQGLRRVDPTTLRVEAFQHDPTDPDSLVDCGIFSLRADRRDDLWIGTNCGLVRRPASGGSFLHVVGPENLPSSTVLAIVEGPQRFWLSTNRGLVSLDKEAARSAGNHLSEQPGALTVWGQEDGIGNLELNRGSVTRDRHGYLMFGGDRGITRFDPTTIETSTYRPPIRLESLALVSRDGSQKLTPPFDGPILIEPDVTSFTAELGTIDFSTTHNRFALRLVGVDPDWIDLGTQRAATYAGVPAGRYRLTARVANRDGLWSDQTLDLELIVVPPFYRTLWFRSTTALVVFGLLVTLGVLISRARFRRQLADLRLQRQRDADRRRISRDLHDELGAGLTQIVLASEREALKPRVDREALRRISGSARGLIDSIRDIIWSIDPQHDHLDRLLSRLRSNLAEQLEAADLTARLDFPEQPPDLPVSPQLRRNLALIAREAVHNLIRHAEARRVTIRCTCDDANLELTIADDGRGFDPEATTSGSGLANMSQRARALGGTLQIESRPREGTCIWVTLPLEQHPV
ncbi:MAG: two-component regulator propeller domain-containing protein [Acidobacteriota bacterium]